MCNIAIIENVQKRIVAFIQNTAGPTEPLYLHILLQPANRGLSVPFLIGFFSSLDLRVILFNSCNCWQVLLTRKSFKLFCSINSFPLNVASKIGPFFIVDVSLGIIGQPTFRHRGALMLDPCCAWLNHQRAPVANRQSHVAPWLPRCLDFR